MFTSDELAEVLTSVEFISDFNWVQYSLIYKQNNQRILFEDASMSRLDYFLEAILASFPLWQNGTGAELCKIGAEIAESLSYNPESDALIQRKYRLKAAILYENAGLPALAQEIIAPNDYNLLVQSFFKRSHGFRILGNGQTDFSDFFDSGGIDDIVNSYFNQNAADLLGYEQGLNGELSLQHLGWALELSKHFSFGLNTTEISAFSRVLENRFKLATIANVNSDLFETLKTISFPSELWPAQVQAIQGGLMNNSYDSFGLASPTGTGKTFLTRLLILKAIQENPATKVLYIVPSRALVYEVSTSFHKAFSELGIEVLAINPQLVMLDGEEEDAYENAQIVVLTPEKADLLVRLGSETLKAITHVIVDEAHHIEADTRGVLLELYLWRIKKLLSQNVRFIFLSAVAPNIHDLTNWIGKNPKSEIVERRATRMRSGVYRIVKNSNNKNEGWIEYSDGLRIRLFEDKVDLSSQRRTLTQLTQAIHKSGPVLVIAKGKKECEHLAAEMLETLTRTNALVQLSPDELSSELYNRLDSRLEREMYPAVGMRKFIKYRIAYHHAGLPPRVRMSLEDAIRKGFIDFVFATTTLAEGVNFPFSSVIVQSLALKEPPQQGISPKYRPITPRTFWNIAGRAGRPGFDKEGQVVLFEPSLGIERINFVLESYLNPNLKDITPVRSALSNSLIELFNYVQSGEINNNELNKIELDEKLPRNIRGTINLLRVGLVHAKAAKLLDIPEDILESTFANSFLKDDVKDFAKGVLQQQNQLLTEFFKSRLAPSEKIVAEMGLSIDTLERLKQYVMNLQDWQMQNFSKLFYGGQLNLNQVGYIIGPVAKNIAELEGNKLGGYLSELIVKWLSGIPLVAIRSELTTTLKNQSLEELIHVIYSRIQFLLPWGLFAVDSIVEEEAKARGINYNNELRSLSYLTDAGVPSFDAHRLVNFDFERVDATRLYHGYMKAGGVRTGVDILVWLVKQPLENLNQIVRGLDGRSMDYDFVLLLENLKTGNSMNNNPSN